MIKQAIPTSGRSQMSTLRIGVDATPGFESLSVNGVDMIVPSNGVLRDSMKIEVGNRVEYIHNTAHNFYFAGTSVYIPTETIRNTRAPASTRHGWFTMPAKDVEFK